MRRRFELLAPQLPAVARINRAEIAVDGGADEDEVAGGGDAATKARCAGRLDALRDELRVFTERNPPRDVSGVRRHRDQLAPRRFRAGVLGCGLPEPAAFGCDF